MIKSVGEALITPLVYLYNKCLASGEYPSPLKTAIVIPIYKRGKKSDIVNYRPISLLSVISKILERILYKRILAFLIKFRIITEVQHGFLPARSTESACIDGLNYIYSELDQGKFVAGIYFDFSVAFDSIETEILIYKLNKLGIRGNLLHLLESFLTNRKIIVQLNNTRSKSYDIDLGVVQGSALGPLLFLLFANDLPNYMPEYCKIIMYADDTSIIVSSFEPDTVKTQLKTVLKEFNQWAIKNRLILNDEKTVCINFYNKKQLESDTNINLMVDGVKIEFSKTLKYLGIYLDEQLNWSEQVNNLAKKLNSCYFAIFNLKRCLERKSLMNVYYALGYSHISYNIQLWGCSVNAHRIFLNQKRIIRLIFNLNCQESCKPYFIKYFILTVPCIFILKSVTYVKENQTKFAKNHDSHKYPTRCGSLIKLPQHKTTLFEKSPQFIGPKLFNNLPQSIREKNSIQAFKSSVKKLLLEKCYYSVAEYLCDS